MASLPSRDALTSLPRWALVAYAARCARRAEPLFNKAWPDAPHQLLTAVAAAVEYAEQAAANAYSQKDLARHHAKAADAAAELAESDGAYFAAHAAANAVGAVAYESEAVAAAYYAASDASAAISAISGGNPEVILADLELVDALAREHNWTNETAVSPDIFLEP